MTTTATWIDRIDDSLNPILVKELRQTVKNRVAIGILTAFLLLQLLMLILGVTTGSDTRSEWSGGRRVFLAQQVILLFTVLTALPIHAGTRLLGERTDPGSDSMFMTTVRPTTIILGKLMAGLTLGMLVFSVCAPFMTLAFLLRGIDLVTVFSVLGLDLLLMLLAMQFAIFVALMPGGLAIKRLFAGFGFFGLFIFTYMLTMFFMFGITTSAASWFAYLLIIIPVLGFFGYFFFYSVALVSPATSNAIFSVRLYLFLFTVLSMLGFLVWAWVGPIFSPAWATAAAELAFVTFSVLLPPIILIQMLVSACERDHWGPRITRTIPRSSLLRLVAFLFYTGSMGGILFCVLMFVTCQGFQELYATLFLSSSSPLSVFNSPSGVKPLWVAGLYAFCFCMMGMLFRRVFPAGWIKPENTWILIAILLGVLSACPNLIAYLVHGDRMTTEGFGWWNLTNPFYYLFSRNWSGGRAPYEEVLFPFLGFWAGALTLFSAPEFIRQIRAFRTSAAPQVPAPVKESGVAPS